MYKRVFRQKGSRVYRARFRLSNSPKIFDVPLRTHKKHVAEAKLTQLIREQEDELAGFLGPKPLRDAAQKPIADHLAEHVANLAALKRSPKHVAFTRNRITRMCQQCGWKLLRDITADGFTRWRAVQATQSPKTLNEYFGHLSAFLTWLERKGHLAHHPLKAVTKVDTRGHERFKRRALSQAELDRLIEAKGGRGLIYFLASYTGLRRGEIKALLWVDLHLEGTQPFIEARAATTKNKKTAMIPLMPRLAQALQAFKDAQGATTGKVLRKGTPMPRTFRRHLADAGIPFLDELGRRVDFHALRYTFDTNLQVAGVAPRVVMELMRHSDMRLSAKTYTDTTRLPVYQELAKLISPLPSPIASPNSDFSCPKEGNVVQREKIAVGEKVTVLRGGTGLLSIPDPDRPNGKMAEREGFEPPVAFRLRLLSKQVHSTTLPPLRT
jgi:integrase